MRADFVGAEGETTWNVERLRRETRSFTHDVVDFRDRDAILRLVAEHRRALVVHASAQSSHDLASSRPFDDCDVNTYSTHNFLVAACRHAPELSFAFLSPNK